MATMTHFGAMSPEAGGHLHPMMALARELQRRGHRVTFYQRAVCEKKIESAGFECRTFDEINCPPEASEAAVRKLSEMNGIRGLRLTIEMVRESIAASLESVPAQMRRDGVQVLLLDEAIASGPTIAEAAGLPYVQLSIALLLDGEPAIPPFCTPWSYRRGTLAIIRNIVAYKILGRMMRPVGTALGDCRRRLGLGA